MSGSVDDIIDALGGTKAVAAALGLNLSTVSSWRAKARGSIPADRWLDLVDLANSLGVKGITAERLAVLHARVPSEPTEARA